jgi:adenylyltransferase/sulfurtransferase
MSKDDEDSIKERYSCDARKKRAIAENKIPTIQTLSSIIAGIQVQEAMRLLHDDCSMIGKMISYDGTQNRLEMSTSYPLKEHDEFHGHGTYVGENVEKLYQVSVNNTLEYFLSSTELLGLDFDLLFSTRKGHDFVTHAHCKICSNDFDVNLPRFRIYADQFNKCPHCGAVQPDDVIDPDKLVITFEGISQLNQNNLSENFLGMRLIDFGFAPLDIIEVVQNGKFRYFELSADHNTLFDNH